MVSAWSCATVPLLAAALLVAGGCGRDDAAADSPESPATPRRVLQEAPLEALPVPDDPNELALAVEERERLAEIEHHVLKLGREGMPPLGRAIVARDRAALLRAFAPDFAGEIVKPGAFRDVAGGLFRTRLSRAGDGAATAAGREQVADYLLALREGFGDSVSAKFKVRGANPVTAGDWQGRWSGRCLLQIVGKTATGGPREASLELTFDLARMPGVDEIGSAQEWITGVSVLEVGEYVSSQSLMSDVAEERGLDPELFHDDWENPDGKRTRTMTGGVYVADVDANGLNDVLVLDPNGLFLFCAQEDGTFRECAEEALLPRDMPIFSAVALADFDGDGLVDLVIGPQVYRNLGKGRFSDVSYKASLPIHEANGAVVADFDLDGRLDLYVVYSYGLRGRVRKTSWFDGPGGPGNQLWLNRGGFRFEQVADRVNAAAGKRSVFTAACLDANDDGRPDIYVISEFGPGVLLLNREDGMFDELRLETRDGDFGSMGLAVGDYDNDGRIDIYTANMFSKAGRRIIDNLAEGSYAPDLMRRMRRFITGSELYHALGSSGETPLRFDRVGERFSLKDVGWAYGATFTDLDGDGYLDLYATAGFVSVNHHEPDG